MGDPEISIDADLVGALERAPVADKSLLEMDFEWSMPEPGEQAVAERLRVFVHTWDPLRAWLDDRNAAFATVNGDGDDFEVVVSVPFTTVQSSLVAPPAISATLAMSWPASRSRR